ncbi:Activator of (R)-2-hydroxyglutaryl-CoA dehydratase [Enhygromyxa salina]|uniref:Activator of (R)-2-hydroxyglutaryl-CoA dehydratase n=1 Tax=Enhygromyxa salina TaxID=215803 RepID=A0A0C1ZMI3_9BACT|nr:2-hydroxyglutaryl-CoA dehydratase [Enhygromyxa salina]KIG18674.1 Activator of (R)-2-hydroxyglutaryl-CoA dehydratase [Enhygromyxa salina]
MNDVISHKLPIYGQSQIADIEKELAEFEQQERQRLGLEDTKFWTDEMVDLGFTKSEKAKITMLLGGLTVAQDMLIEAAVKAVGYNILALDRPDNESLRLGKEFGNRAQCNPTYYTVGNLVKYLTALRDEKGMATQDIIDKFVFFTAGSCGPCRFGMYATEYRKALRDAGFDGFRVMLFQEKGGVDQATGEDSGLDMSPKFFAAIIRGLLIGDVINGLGYRIRPYERVPGATNIALEQAKKVCYDAFTDKKPLIPALHKAKKIMASVEVDHMKVRPFVGITGEFWAMTTEGDGNYYMQRFLEQEGAEVKIQFVTEWLLYNIWEEVADLEQRELLREHDPQSGLEEKGRFGAFKKRSLLWMAQQAVRAGWTTYSEIMGYHDYHLHSVAHGTETAKGFYSSELRGGEGHMEVANTISNFVDRKTNMTLSVKPFGCMPSSGISDGVQSVVAERYPGTIFCAVETSGDGAVNFYSRVQMFLFKAQKAAEKELESALEDCELTLDQVNDYIAKTPKFSDTLYFPTQRKIAACKAARMVYDVRDHMNTTAWERGVNKARKLADDAVGFANATREASPALARGAKVVARELGEEAVLQLQQRVPLEKLPVIGSRFAARSVH